MFSQTDSLIRSPVTSSVLSSSIMILSCRLPLAHARPSLPTGLCKRRFHVRIHPCTRNSAGWRARVVRNTCARRWRLSDIRIFLFECVQRATCPRFHTRAVTLFDSDIATSNIRPLLQHPFMRISSATAYGHHAHQVYCTAPCGQMLPP